MTARQTSLADNLICHFDRALRVLSPNTEPKCREVPQAKTLGDEPELTPEEKRHAAGLMRVNHSGEICAQALYHGQGFTAKLPGVREKMEQSADEETDHLSWCETRVKQLDSHTSVFNPLWYGLSFGIGATAGLISDKVSLGFVAATEEQVCQHLEKHLHHLPARDEQSRAIVEQMLVDENKHAEEALNAGGVHFPKVIKHGMSVVSKVMTFASYRL